ncbi:MAG: hypothetical protein QOE84_3178 [Actinomycetota bacterium]|nr:hypothetical protein [Actinomycetota bacterium]
MKGQGQRSRLRVLDDSLDRLLRRNGSSLMGEHAGAQTSPSCSRFWPYVAVIIVVAVAGLVGGGDPAAVVLGAVGFAFACGLIVRRQSGWARLDAATRQQRAARRVRVAGLLLAGMGAGFAFAGMWQVTGLLVFLAAFLNGSVWFIKRYDKTRNAKQN